MPLTTTLLVEANRGAISKDKLPDMPLYVRMIGKCCALTNLYASFKIVSFSTTASFLFVALSLSHAES